MKNYILPLFFFLLPLSCTKEDSDVLTMIDNISYCPELKENPVFTEKRNQKLTPKIAYKKWQLAMKTLSKKTKDSFLKELSLCTKKIKLIDSLEIKKRAGLILAQRNDIVFDLGIFFTEKIHHLYLAEYSEEFNIIIFYDYKNIFRYGDLNLVSVATIYAHELVHVWGHQRGLNVEQEHKITPIVEEKVFETFLAKTKDSIILFRCIKDSLSISCFIKNELEKYGDIVISNAIKIQKNGALY